jgi:hypothetical protein
MLGNGRVFLAVGGTLGVLFLLSFTAVAVLKVATGHSLDVYYTPWLGPVPVVVALAAVVFAVAAMTFAWALRLIDWYSQRRKGGSV